MITNQTVKARYAGNGINRRWGIPFQYTDVNQICITVVENETERVLDPSEFTVSTETGAVTYPKSADDPALKTGATLVVYRSTNVTQESDLTNQGGAWPETIEAGLDKLTAIAQEHKEHLGRAILTTIGSNKTAEEYIKLLKDYTIDASNSAAQAGQTLQDVIANKEASSANADRAEYYANTAIEQAEAVKIAAIPITEHNTAADAHADIRQAIENIDVSQDIQKHNTDPDAHANMKAGIPVGTIIATGNTNIPDGYLLCDGGAISRTTYSALFAAVGETYGAGDGSTTFNLPLLTDGRFLEGGFTAGNKHSAGAPNIEGVLSFGFEYGLHNSAATNTSGSFSLGNIARGAYLDASSTYQGYDAIFNANKSNSIYGNSETIQPESLCIKYLIKYI